MPNISPLYFYENLFNCCFNYVLTLSEDAWEVFSAELRSGKTGEISLTTFPLVTRRLMQPTNPFRRPVCCRTIDNNVSLRNRLSAARSEGTEPKYSGPLRSKPSKRPSGTDPRTIDSLLPLLFSMVSVPFLFSLEILTVCHSPSVTGFGDIKIADPVPTS